MWHFMEHIKASTLGRRKAYKQEVSQRSMIWGRAENSKGLSAGAGNISTDSEFSLCCHEE